jgi:hypothetical protein
MSNGPRSWDRTSCLGRESPEARLQARLGHFSKLLNLIDFSFLYTR